MSHHHPPTPSEIPDESESGEDLRPSKSQKKRESTALQDMGAELVALSRDQLKKIDLPDNLRTAVRDCQRFTSHGAISRQMQYIGKLMRGIDPAPIQAVLDEINGISNAANARQHALERLRASLLGDESVLGEIARDHPGADMRHLRQLRRNALKEQEHNKPPRAFRELFRVLRDLNKGKDDHVTDDPGIAGE
ncbi:MAG: ribosome biogenesis factor YjgA [Rhodocyclaceae bacterium]|nr:ribosome biogenesis factor YjgA [Rhodocyclaceae bacterium]